MTVSHNLNAAIAKRGVGVSGSSIATAVERLSSGYRINSAKDDPSGLVISEQLRSQEAGLQRALQNTDEAMNVLGIVEGALSEINHILRNLKSIGLHAMSDGVITPEQIAADQAEVDIAVQALDRIARTTSYAGQSLLSGGKEVHFGSTITVKNIEEEEKEAEEVAAPSTTSAASADGDIQNPESPFVTVIGENGTSVLGRLKDLIPLEDRLKNHAVLDQVTGQEGRDSKEMEFQITDSTDEDDKYVLTIPSMTMDALGKFTRNDQSYTLKDILSGGSACLRNDPSLMLEIVEKSINEVTMLRAHLGAVQANVLESNKNCLAIAIEHIQKSESTIRDTDMAATITEYTKQQVVQNASLSMLSQANTMGRYVLHLIG